MLYNITTFCTTYSSKRCLGSSNCKISCLHYVMYTSLITSVLKQDLKDPCKNDVFMHISICIRIMADEFLEV